MGSHADAAPAIHPQKGKDHVVVTGIDAHVAQLRQPACLLQIGIRLFDRNDVLNLVELAQGLRFNVGDTAARDIIEDDRLAVGRIRQSLEVLYQTRHRRLVVIRSDRQDGVDALLAGAPGQLDAVGGVVGAGAGDDGGASGDRVTDDPDKVDLLVVGKGR